MNFKLNDNIDEFDFSIKSYTLNDCLIVVEERPYNIEDEIFDLLSESIKDKGEYRFAGIIDNNGINYYIERLYKFNDFVWNNVFYDEFASLLESIKHKDNFHRIHNHLLY